MIRRQTASRVETLEEALAREVLDGRFQPGEHLGEISLAEEYKVGRNTLRAAPPGALRGTLVDEELLDQVIDQVRELNGRQLDDDLAVLALGFTASGS